MDTEKLPLILGIGLAGIGLVLLLPKIAKAEELVPVKREVLKPLPVVTVTLSGFSWSIETFVKDMKAKGYIISSSCAPKGTFVVECRAEIYFETLDAMKNVATNYGVSLYA